tara:strand:+ start:3865 stop:3990 length:126 start_codon:yes stop_codon:yes gene_type:complete
MDKRTKKIIDILEYEELWLEAELDELTDDEWLQLGIAGGHI